MTVSEAKEALSQLYAYTGFPRSLNALGTLQKVLSARQVEFVDIHTEDRKVGHVHNVTNPDLPESREVNGRMIDFMLAEQS